MVSRDVPPLRISILRDVTQMFYVPILVDLIIFLFLGSTKIVFFVCFNVVHVVDIGRHGYDKTGELKRS